MRGIDHIVVVTQDLAALAEAYRRLGFMVGRRNRHPWGTENHIIQFGSSFFELLGFAEDFVKPNSTDATHPFAGYLTEWSAGGRAGGAMLVLGSDDAEADKQAFQAAGIGAGRILPFSRSAQGPDGAERTVAFTIAFAAAPAMPDVGFFTCQQHRPENFWNPAVQTHANGASTIVGTVILADDPAAHAAFATRFAGSEVGGQGADWLHVATAGGRIEILTRSALARRYGLMPDPNRDSPCIVAAVLAVADPQQTRKTIPHASVLQAGGQERLVVPPAEAGAMALIFERS